MELQINIKMDNDAFCQHGEVSRILNKLSQRLESITNDKDSERILDIWDKFPLYDYNGNKCGVVNIVK